MTDLQAPSDPSLDELPEDSALTAEERRARRRRKLRNKLIKDIFIVTHRWVAIILGLVVVVITTTGAIALYSPEWRVWTNTELYTASSQTTTVTPGEAIDIVQKAHPDFAIEGVTLFSGVYEVSSLDPAVPTTYIVDPGNGEIKGSLDRQLGFMGAVRQIHDCFFTCPAFPGYVPFLAEPLPTFGFIFGPFGAPFNGAQLVLGITGILVLFLAIGGIILWWPGFKKWKRGFEVRRGQGRYARDFDLHKLIGLITIPFLLVWGLTGANFQFQQVQKAWYAVTGGEQIPDDQYEFYADPPADPDTPPMTVDEAAAAATAVVPGNPILIYPPYPGDPTGYYTVQIDHAPNPFYYSTVPGNIVVAVDPYNAEHTKVMLGASTNPSNFIFAEGLTAFGHLGYGVNGWWRIIWFVFGMTPLILMVTGMSTWLYKAGVKRRKNRARRDAALSA